METYPITSSSCLLDGDISFTNTSPVAEKTFQLLRKFADKHPEINFVAISHSDEEATERWVIAIGGEWDVHVIVDPGRELYAQWGLGVSGFYHVLSPSMELAHGEWKSLANVWKLCG
jgi:hypothetical protein